MARMTTVKKLWIAIGILALLSPLGLIIPALFGADGAWGEWGAGEIGRMFGFIPEGMKRTADKWSSPMPAYTVPGQGGGLAGKGLGYVLAAMIGIAAVAGAAYLLTLFFRRNKSE